MKGSIQVNEIYSGLCDVNAVKKNEMKMEEDL